MADEDTGGATQVLKGLQSYEENIWGPVFTMREKQLIANSTLYAAGYPAGGLPAAHNLMIIIDKFQRLTAHLASYLTDDQMAALKTRLEQADFLKT